MSTSPQTGGQRVIYVQLDHEPEVTHEVRLLSPFISATVCGQRLGRSRPCLQRLVFEGRLYYPYYTRHLGGRIGRSLYSQLLPLTLIHYIYRDSQ